MCFSQVVVSVRICMEGVFQSGGGECTNLNGRCVSIGWRWMCGNAQRQPLSCPFAAKSGSVWGGSVVCVVTETFLSVVKRSDTVNPFTAMLAAPSLRKGSIKVPNLKPLRLVCPFARQHRKWFLSKCTVLKVRFVIGPSNRQFAGVSVCTFQCCGSEGVKLGKTNCSEYVFDEY